ncbi:DUF1192 domain-containing protein [Fodinicurvata fenggangensis]|uniref:DUF1192 domain-containing protein n=1 Tax=Fodinicurvata fenggangensis TaxID=1121830 RepID=UPI00047A6AED|nr:DUF1192 domain-containing protein [Fodinicurvata fenggangensis]
MEMDPEEELPRRGLPVGRDLELMGIAELKDYLSELEAEMERVKEKISAKSTHLSAASELFKT